MAEKISVNGIDYKVEGPLGHGKYGRNLVVNRNGNRFVLCQLEDRLQLEARLSDYERLKSIRVLIPDIVETDKGALRILRELIEGVSVSELAEKASVKSEYFCQLGYMLEVLKDAGLSIDFSPERFMVQRDILYYTEYECFGYTDETSFENTALPVWQGKEDIG